MSESVKLSSESHEPKPTGWQPMPVGADQAAQAMLAMADAVRELANSIAAQAEAIDQLVALIAAENEPEDFNPDQTLD